MYTIGVKAKNLMCYIEVAFIFYEKYFFVFIFIEFIGVTVVNKIIQVLIVKFY